MKNLSNHEWSALLRKVFAPGPADKGVLILVDLPDEQVPDTDDWRDRRLLAQEWLTSLQEIRQTFGFERVEALFFGNTGNNNADFPDRAFKWSGDFRQASYRLVSTEGQQVGLEEELGRAQIVFAPVHFSATAPLKHLARKYGFRAASMPGFSRTMIPALGIDFELVHERVTEIKLRLDRALAIDMRFLCDGQEYQFHIDTRHRDGHASSGLLREPGSTWNLPSGESYIVPYEGELDVPSQTEGLLPVQFGDELVVYEIRENRAIAVKSEGRASNAEADRLRAEPAYGNIAEIGFGVLQPFGIKPAGVILLDEKLGLHIAFGRSDHFGGATSPASFNDRKNVVHIDRIYLPEMQDKIIVKTVVFRYPDGASETVMRDSRYVI